MGNYTKILMLDKNTIHPRDDAPTMFLHKREPTDIESHCVFLSFFNHVYSLDIGRKKIIPVVPVSYREKLGSVGRK